MYLIFCHGSFSHREYYIIHITKLDFWKDFTIKCVLHSLRSRTLNLPLSRAGVFLLNYIRIYLQGKSIRSGPIQTFLTSFVKYQNWWVLSLCHSSWYESSSSTTIGANCRRTSKLVQVVGNAPTRIVRLRDGCPFFDSFTCIKKYSEQINFIWVVAAPTLRIPKLTVWPHSRAFTWIVDTGV